MAPEDAEEEEAGAGESTIQEEGEQEAEEKLPDPRSFVKVCDLGPWLTKDKAKTEYPVHGSIDVLRTNDKKREVWLSQNGPGSAKSFVRLGVLTEIGRKKMLDRRALVMEEEAARKARKDAAYREAHGEA
mmetsp:Transcript_50355/g.119266  ORF Transcript_50355/g.119266 Transcript_50355/m.119266 type:complete len:130 (+) Transcript_50355:76-465(+)